MKYLIIATLLFLSACGGSDKIGEVNTKFNFFSPSDTIVVEAFNDPDIDGITCYLSRAKTGGMQGMVGIAEDTADGAISCVKTQVLSSIDRDMLESKNGDKVFKQSTSLMFKSMQVIRSFDKQRNVVTYLVYSDRIIEGSPNNAISAVYLGRN